MAILDPELFSASTLAGSKGLKVALEMLESCLAAPDIPLDLIIQDLCFVPNLFGFTISVLPTAMGLIHRVLAAHPVDPTLFKTSLACTLLQTLSSTIRTLPAKLLPVESIRRIKSHTAYVEASLPLLDLLYSIDFSVIDVRSEEAEGKTWGGDFSIDLSLFHRLGINVPLNAVEASQVACDVTAHLKIVLKFYLDLLLEPSLAEPLRAAYISTDCSPFSPDLSVDCKVHAIHAMAAPVHFEKAKGFGEWRIIVGTHATKKLREFARSDRDKCLMVVKKIKQLSNGRFFDDNQRRINGDSGVPIFEAKVQMDLRIVYQIDVVPNYEEDLEQQVLRIYGVYTHLPPNHIWDAVAHQLARKGKEYCDRCMVRNPSGSSGGDVYLPALFVPGCSPDDLDTKPSPTALVLSNEDMGELHSLLVLDKYVTFSQIFLNGLIMSQDLEHIFEVTPQERKVIECTTSCYVLGRSGTGKTTTMLFKMLGIQQAWEINMSDMPKPRQIFVTKSPALVNKVKEYFAKLLDALALAGYSLEELKSMHTRGESVNVGNKGQGNVPKKYSALEDTHFPLFVTYDQLASMIAADTLIGDDPKNHRAAKAFVETDENEVQTSLVTYDVFARSYWPHFPRWLTNGLESWLVFSELIGIIKGSEQSLSCPGGFLDAKTYCGLSARSYPTFANQRETVYAIFEAYRKVKQGYNQHDVADRTHAILNALVSGTPLGGQKVDFLYIDEAQDNLLIDALLLRSICRNPEGLFWAGDTAQTISAGSSFRFNDLKAFLHRIEQDHSKRLIQDRSVKDPEAFQLAINYRSHGGIVNCAHSVIERIMQFWPDAIDGLRQERGVVDSVKPVFLCGWDQDTTQYEQFLFGESGNRIEFGAHQCILVRDNEALVKLQNKVGVATIMTLYDSKGLEFNDVLLYNFFEDSAIDEKHWRVLLSRAKGEVDGQDISKMHAPSFERDESRYAGICSELKQLYVGITRARQNLWIFDQSDKGEPMRLIWTSRNQIQNCTPATGVPRLARSSTAAEWESFGRELLIHERYAQAMQCFITASQPHMVEVCKAFQLREDARAKVGVAPMEVQQQAFAHAAEAFVAVGTSEPSGNEKSQYYRNAAGCYVCAGLNQKAAKWYFSIRDYDQAARYFTKATLFDKALEILHKYSSNMTTEVSEALYTECQLFYCTKQDGTKPPYPLFKSFEKEETFLREHKLHFALVLLLEAHGRYSEAANLHLAQNRPLDAIKDFLKEKSHDATKRATKILLDGLWCRCSFAITSEKVAADEHFGELLNLALEFSPEYVDPSIHDEISMFRAIAEGDLCKLDKLSRTFLEEGRNEEALLTLDHFFTHLPTVKSYKLREMSIFLDQFRQYSRLLHDMITYPDPLSVARIRRFFCIRDIPLSTECSVERNSFLHDSIASDRRFAAHRRHAAARLVPKRQLVVALRERLSEHLRNRVTAENELCCDAVAFIPCLTFVVTQQCSQADKCPLDHVERENLDAKYYNTRVGVYLQQICILQYVYSVPVNSHLSTADRKCIINWLLHLYEALNPEHHIQGSIADLDLSSIPGGSEGRRVVEHWVQDSLRFLTATYGPTSGLLTTLLKLTSLLYTFSRSDASKCINQAPVVTQQYRHRVLSYPDGSHVVQDIVSFLDGTSISAGLKFLRHVLRSSLSLDLSVFCDCLENVICGILSSWSQEERSRHDFHCLVLPRGWFTLQDMSQKEVNIDLLLKLLHYVRHLLLSLQSGAASDIYVLSHTKLTPILCDVFTARICRALGLLASNSRISAVRRSVEQTFKTLEIVEPIQLERARFLHRNYTHVKPDEYLKVIVAYDEGVVIQDLVQLVDTRRVSNAPLGLLRVTDVQYEDPLDIPSLMTPHLRTARPRAEDSAFAPHTLAQASPSEGTEDPGTEVSLEAELARNEAALTIQFAYRAYRNRRERSIYAVGQRLQVEKHIVFMACLRNLHARGWEKSRYRTLYLWALPPLVVCLDEVISISSEFKRKAKKRFAKESNERLEAAKQELNNVNTLSKECRQMRDKIGPDAVMHHKSDEAVMRKVLFDVKGLIDRLPVEVPEIQEEFDVAYRCVIGEQPMLEPEVLEPE